MEIKINTKFNINDIVYGFYGNRIYKFHINNIIINYRCYGNIQITYDVSAIIPNSEVTFSETYNEFDLFTKEEIKTIFENFLKEDTSKHPDGETKLTEDSERTITREEQILKVSLDFQNSPSEPDEIDIKDFFRKGAEWTDKNPNPERKKKFIENICKWIEDIHDGTYLGVDDYGYSYIDRVKFIEDLKQVMEKL